jgi:hypothetical protein
MAKVHDKRKAILAKAIKGKATKKTSPKDLKNLGKKGKSPAMFGKTPMVAPTTPDQIGSGMGDNLGTNGVF